MFSKMNLSVMENLDGLCDSLNFSFGHLALELLLGSGTFVTSAWELWIGSSGLGALAWNAFVWDFPVGELQRDLSLGELQLGSLGGPADRSWENLDLSVMLPCL